MTETNQNTGINKTIWTRQNNRRNHSRKESYKSVKRNV